MKVIFLDHDGVICLSTDWGGRQKKWAKYRRANPESSQSLKDAPVEVRFDNFNKKAIKILNQIIKETDAELVVSSDWKLHATLSELGDYYKAQGIIKRPIAITPNLHEFDPNTNDLFMYKGWLERKRILEINKYLKLHLEIKSWVVIDDLNMSTHANGGYGLHNFVLTPKSSEGIKQCGIKENILTFLKQN